MYRSASIRGVVPSPLQSLDTLTRQLWLEPLWIGILAIALLLPGRLLPVTWHPLLLAALFLFWPLRWLLRRQLTQINSIPPIVSLSMGLLLLWLPLSLLTSIVPSISWETSGYLLLGVTLYNASINHPWLQERPLRLFWHLLTVSILLIITAPSITQWKSEFRLFYIPLYDFFGAIALNGGETLHANLLAGALVLLTPLMLTPLLTAKPSVHKVVLSTANDQEKTIRLQQSHGSNRLQKRFLPFLLTLLLIPMLGLLLLTQSRGAYLSLAVILLLIGLLRWPRALYLLPVLGAGLAFFSYRSGFGQLFELLGADNTFGGADWRTPVWRASWQAFQDFTWTGIGIGNFRQVMPFLYPNPAINNEAATHAHNLLLQIGLDLGLPGLVAYIGFYLTMVGMAIAVLRRMRSPKSTATALGATWDGDALIAPPEVGVSISTGRFMRQLSRLERTRQQHWALAAGCLAALVGMQVHGLLDAVTWGNKLAFIPWLIFAQITLLYRYQNDEE